MKASSSLVYLPRSKLSSRQQAVELREAILITKEMIAVAESEEWDRLAELQEKRDIKLRNCLAKSPQVSDAAEVRAAIRRLLELNEGLIDRVTRAKQQLVGERFFSRARYNAAATYLSS